MWPHFARWLMTLALGILLTPLGAHAQLAGKVPRIGIVGNEYSERTWGVFRHVMHDLGYVEGVDFELVYRSAGGQMQRLPWLATDLVPLSPDAILAVPPPACGPCSPCSAPVCRG